MQIPKRKPGKYTHRNLDPFITRKKFDQLTKKLKRLKEERPTLALEVGRLAELGDFSENVEYQLAKRKLRSTNRKILWLEHQLNHAKIIEPSSNGTVQIGSTVTVLVGTKQKGFQILGSAESNPDKNIISYSSPIGAALIGKKVGDTAAVHIGEREIEYTLIDIEND